MSVLFFISGNIYYQSNDDCLMCHSLESVKPFPADHEGRTIGTCLSCHQAAVPAEAEEMSEEDAGDLSDRA